jgi:hypothetical protein
MVRLNAASKNSDGIHPRDQSRGFLPVIYKTIQIKILDQLFRLGSFLSETQLISRDKSLQYQRVYP